MPRRLTVSQINAWSEKNERIQALISNGPQDRPEATVKSLKSFKFDTDMAESLTADQSMSLQLLKEGRARKESTRFMPPTHRER